MLENTPNQTKTTPLGVVMKSCEPMMIKYSVCFSTAIEKNLWFLVIKIRLNNDYFTLAGVYHSPNHSHVEFINFLKNWLNKNLLNISHTFLIFGDFNINWSSNLGYCNRLKSVIDDFGLKYVVCLQLAVVLLI